MICLMCGHKINRYGFLNRKSHYKDCLVLRYPADNMIKVSDRKKVIKMKKMNCPYCNTEMINRHTVNKYPYRWCECPKCHHWSVIEREVRKKVE